MKQKVGNAVPLLSLSHATSVLELWILWRTVF
jgi:hypothetical protein